MSNDPYSPCVCGSGKKLKFCCQDIVPDMARIQKLMDNQPEAAEKQLRSLLQKHQDKEVIVTQLSSLLAESGRVSEARDLLVDFLRKHPDEPRALLALADVCLSVDGFAAARRVVHRAFQLSSRQYPTGVSMLAATIAGQLARAGCFMAVREHMALAVRMAPPQTRNSLLMQLANFESQRSVSYPFRGSFSLLPVELEGELQKEELRARKVSQIGCWEPASILYKRLLEQLPENGSLWFNLGLFQAWDGRLKEAAQSFHKAAELIDDYDTAVEAETLALLLEIDITEDRYTISQQTINVRSLSELLTRLDAAEGFVRLPRTAADTERDDSIVAEYELLADPSAASQESGQLPDVLAEISIVETEDADGEQSRAVVVGLSDELPKAVASFLDVAGDLATPVPEDQAPAVISQVPAVCQLFDWKVHQPEQVSMVQMRTLEEDRLKAALNKWLEIPTSLLDGKSPLELSRDAKNLIRAGAVVLVLDAICHRMGHHPDLTEVRNRLGVPAPSPMQVTSEQSITAMPLLRLHRVDAEKLTDDQLFDFASRMILVRHFQLMEQALTQLANRPAAIQRLTPLRTYLMLATLARENNDLERASGYFNEAREAVKDDKDAFRLRLEIDIRELSCRLDNPEDPGVKTLLEEIRDRYFVKIPEIEEVIREELESSGAKHLIPLLYQKSTHSPKGGVWTPGAQQETASTGGKLWIPGQD
ncbi:MAG: tetratricopeptide repeat protein [Planctomycetaceae bacterium]|nr:tetratricopeptide repeat protein [Planctomycetaceae bacterium]